MSLIKGLEAEKTALNYLLQQGYQLVVCNYRCRLGEIDLIMLMQRQVIFIEVRQRSDDSFGSAAQSVDVNKQRKITKTAAHFLQCNRQYDDFSARFDVIAIEGKDAKILWYENAFGQF